MRIQEFNGFQTNLLQSILWQYNEATNLLSLLNAKQTWYNTYQTQFWLDWYNHVFFLANPIETFTIFGATVWSIILNIPLFVPIIDPPPADFLAFGFNAYDPTFPTLENTYENFTHGNFYPYNAYISLTVFQQQFLLRLRYFQLSNLGDIVDINAFLFYLCNNSLIGYAGTIYAVDNLDMSMTYVFTVSGFPDELFNALVDLDVLPRPAGVAISYSGI